MLFLQIIMIFLRIIKLKDFYEIEPRIFVEYLVKRNKLEIIFCVILKGDVKILVQKEKIFQ